VSLTSPIRNPDMRDPAVMSRRAWWLILLSIFMPGSAQLIAGNRRLGRVLFGIWLLLLAVGVGTFVAYFIAGGATLSFWVSFWGLLGVQALLVVFAILSFVAAVDTFRLVRFVHIPGRTRVWVALLTVVAMLVPAGAAAYGSFLAGVTRATIGGIFAGRTSSSLIT